MTAWRCALELDSKRIVTSGSTTELADAIGRAADLRTERRLLPGRTWTQCQQLLCLDNPRPFLRKTCQNTTPLTVGIRGPMHRRTTLSMTYYTEQQLFMIGSHPLVRVSPGVPMQYASCNWDFGWLMVRSDGHVVYRRCDPYSLRFSDHVTHNAVRWFVR